MEPVVPAPSRTPLPKPTATKLQPTSKPTIKPTQKPTQKPTSFCSDALPTRLDGTNYAYVSKDPPLNNRIRKGAGLDYDVVGYIATGNAMEILDGPRCSDGIIWWRVRSIKNSRVVGWTAEGDNVYWLVPCKSLNSCQ